MFRNYYKIALRHIGRSRLHSAINVIGLSTGISFTLLIAAFCYGEWQVNRQLRNADRQYILTTRWKDPNMGYPMSTCGQLAKALKENYPGLVANYYRFDGVISTVSNGDKHFREDLQMGDSTLFTMYGFRLLQGDPRTALVQPFSVVITADKAIKYFGRTDVVGQNLTIENFSGGKTDFRVTGVLPEPSRNSVTWLNEANNNRVFVPVANLDWFGRNMDWANPHIASYVELQKGVDPAELAGPIQRLVGQNATPEVAANMQVIPVPLTTYYLTGAGGTVQKMLYTLSFAALFILLMAIVNFVNLSVSRSTARMKEIGIRKVLGSLRRQLIGQFLMESIVLAMVAGLLSLVLYLLFRPLFSGMLTREIPSLTELPAMAWPLVAGFTAVTGLLAGLYPALRLSGLASVDSLKGRAGAAESHIILRKGLVGFQFVTATVAVVAAIVISQQIGLFFSDRLGYDREYLVAAQVPRDWTYQGEGRMRRIRSELAMMPGIKDATLSFEIPDGGNGGSRDMWPDGGDSAHAVTSQALMTDEHYSDTYRIPMAAGVFYNREGESSASDSLRVVLNATAARALGWNNPEAAIGQRLRLAGTRQPFVISGVIKDFHFEAMGSAVQPELFMHVDMTWTYRYLSFRLRPGNIGTTMEQLRRRWAALMPGAAFEYRFMDETLENLYRDELRLKKAASVATVLALIIVLLGVVGLLSMSVQKRTKEIAIRKVIGASVPGIIRLFLREYLPLLLVAGVAAAPVAWLLMNRWLSDYATRIMMGPWPFVAAVAGLCVVMVVLIVVRTVSAALANPVKSLSAE
ncbi:ABC transporter permease [Puia sp. P3]|uniref:ABC transporter permease n=1 Tax=Puia sp. P3 TaxID=3423952 RepID=UPI003D66B17C